MASPISPPSTDAWRADPSADFLCYQLIGVTRAALGMHFSDESAEENYNARLSRETSKKRGGAPWFLQAWEEHRPQGTLRLTAQPEPNAFILRLAHPMFGADIAVTYDIDEAELESAKITRFRGTVALALESARFWVDELTDFGLDELDMDETELKALISDLESEDDEDESDTPAEDTAEDRREARRIAQALAARIGDDAPPPELPEIDQQWLDAAPQSLWPILEGAVDTAEAETRDEKLLAAWLMLLDQVLEQLRYRMERGFKWAADMLDQYQESVKDLAEQKTLKPEDLFALVTALGRAKVPVKSDLSEAVMDAGASLPDSIPPEQALDLAVRPLIEEMARTVTSPFDVIEAMQEAAGIAPPALRSFIAHELALSPHAVMRDAVPLMLLDAEAEVRQAAALALDQAAGADGFSPVSLRRAIALRNWIPEADRATLDQAVRKARAKGVEPAQWPPALELTLRASPVDGGGAQSLLFASRSGRSGLFAGLLLKQGVGVRDAWCDRETSRREIATMAADMQRKLTMPEIDRAYIDLAAQHGIAAGLQSGTMPEPALLDIAEALGGADWKANPIDVAVETQRLFGALSAEQTSAEAIAASLRQSADFMRRESLWDSWFEDDAEVADWLATQEQYDADTAARGLLDGILDGRRGLWAERFLLTALWARAVKGGQPPPLGAAARAVTWQDMVVLAHEVLFARPLAEIPVMTEIALRTVTALRDGGG